jgi:hypothetical protein
MSLGQKGSGQNVWDELITGQNDRGRSERDKMSVGRNEWDEMIGCPQSQSRTNMNPSTVNDIMVRSAAIHSKSQV